MTLVTCLSLAFLKLNLIKIDIYIRIKLTEPNVCIKFFCFQEGSEERHIQQMQYIAWPDHGVPDESTDFLDFVIKVRQNRMGMVEPTIVHCR